ncbi:MAG: 50S ribosomal protein L19, partial [Paludibacteraceae bacterium]|nr:50S ribosomal protein L19 [Paludibacteraceae bacterium]MBR5574590.1 50S ribosomal protein L19 [Paludibacteraceae bacterium]
MDLMKIAEEAFAGEKKEFPAFAAGDQVTVAYRIKEGNKERIQEFR